MQDDDLISIAQCARAIGIHKTTLGEQVKKKQVRSHGKKVRLSEVLEDRIANIDLSRSGRRAGRLDDVDSDVGSIASDPTFSRVDPTPGEADPTETVIVDGKPMSYSEAKRMKEGYLAKLRQVEYHEKIGEVVHVEDVTRLVVADYAVVRNKLLSLPGIVAPRLVGRTPEEIREAVRQHLDEILTNLSSGDEIVDGARKARKGRAH